MASNEVTKLQQHLALLKEEYSKLQSHCAEVERKYTLAAASAGDLSETSFVARLLMTVAGLYGRDTYSDIKIKLQNQSMPAHKFVLIARSDDWSEIGLKNAEELDWSTLPDDIGAALLRWIYTDLVDLSKGDTFVLQLMKAAANFRLTSLVNKCEQALITTVGVRTCVKFYSAADEIGAVDLKDHCSGLISSNWDDLTGEDFAHMSSALLYRMLKSKTEMPLHQAIKLLREDVVFLCLVENHANLTDIVNSMSHRGELPLQLALRGRSVSIATTLLQHSADPDGRGPRGRTLLHVAIDSRDAFAAKFLLDNGANPNLVSKDDFQDTALHLISALSSNCCDDETLDQMVEVAELLLERGADINKQNKKGFTPLHRAIITRNQKIFDLLLKQSELDTNIPCSEHNHTPLYYALVDDRRASISSSETLVMNGSNPFDSPVTNKDAFADEDDAKSDYVIERTYALKLLQKGCERNPVYEATGDTLIHVLAQGWFEDAAIFLSSQNQGKLNALNKNGWSAMHTACSNGLARLTACLLDNYANPNIQTDYLEPQDTVYRRTPLHYAVVNNHEGCVAAIVAHKKSLENHSRDEQDHNEEQSYSAPDMNLVDSRGLTASMCAFDEGHVHLIPLLIDGGSDPNIRNQQGVTLLHQAIIKEDSKTALTLLDHGADLNLVTMEGESPLILSIHYHLGLVVEGLSIRGADTSKRDIHGLPPLWVALESGQDDVASILIRNGADADCWGPANDGTEYTLLHKAIEDCKESAATFLIRAGCDIESPRREIQDGDHGPKSELIGQTPLHRASCWGLAEVVQTLLEHGANINAQDSTGKTPLHTAMANQHDAVVSLLLTQPGINLSARDNQGITPFAAALMARNHKAAQAIYKKMPSAAEQVDRKGRNFLHVAIQKCDVESVMFLLAVEVDVNSRIQDATLTPSLHLAAEVGNEVLLRSLLLAGARPNDKDANKRTALHVASAAGHAQIVQALLSGGVECNAVDVKGDNALHTAVRHGHAAVVRALLVDSDLNAALPNAAGRNPLHELCWCKKDNAASICEIFLELMPDFPINKTDLQGNTPLLLSYMNGQGALCRVLVKAGACLAQENKDGISMFNYQVATKQLLLRLLDTLVAEAPWADSELCQECGTKFTLTMRKHHCRHCGRMLCNKCSNQVVPILKFNMNKPQRVCEICFNVLQVGAS